MSAHDLRAMVINDIQFPYHDPTAVDVASQIGKAYKPEVLVLNGDIYDLLNLSRHPSIKTDLTAKVAMDFESEIERGFEFTSKLIKSIAPERVVWHNGNHEARFLRVMATAPREIKQMTELKVVRNAYSYPNLFRLNEMSAPVHFVGEWPNGSWLHHDLPPDKNVWIEHGYTARKKAGYTCTALMEDRGCSVVCGHCEKLAGPLWVTKVGNRKYFGIENGNLSILAEPGGEGLYQGAPHSVPQYMNHTQGLSLVTYSSGEWHPQVIRIASGKAMWGNRSFESRA